MSYNKIPADCPYSLKSFKTFHGHDGNGYEVIVTLNRKPLFMAVDDGWGGGLQYHAITTSKNEEAYSAARRAMNEAIKALDAYAKSLPNYDPDDLFPEGLSMSGELLIEELVNKLEDERNREKNRKRFAKFILTETLFRLKGDEPGSWRSVKVVGPGVAPHLRTKHGDALEIVLNEAMLTNPFAWEGH